MTQQRPLFDGVQPKPLLEQDAPLPHQRHSPTSVAAAVAAQPRAGTELAAVLAALQGATDGLTDEECQGHLGMNPSTQRPRRVELVARGMVRDSGRTRRTASGRSAVVWVAV